MPMLLKDSIIDKLENINWDFTGEKTQYLTHRVHSYPARFIPQIPKQFIEAFTKVQDIVLDPMCGSGTTLVEAVLAGRQAIGNDYNPLAVLISKVKTTMIQSEDFEYLGRQLKLLGSGQQTTNSTVKHKLPKRKISKLFTKKHLNDISAIKQMISNLGKNKKSKLCDFCLVALSSTVWSFIESEGKSDILNLFQKKIQLMKREILELNSLPLATCHPPTLWARLAQPFSKKELGGLPLVICGDARSLGIDSNLVDLIVTSPPYVNALDYYREHMYNMVFLDIDVNRFKKNEIGGHSRFIANRFRLLSTYFGDMLRAMLEFNRVLKTGKYCVIVVGNSSLEYELIESHKHFTFFAELIGFKHEITLFRNIDKTKKYTSKEIGQINDEYIVVLKKQSNSKIDISDHNSITDIVTSQLYSLREEIGKSSRLYIKGKMPTKARLKDNLAKITDAIDLVSLDVKL